MLCGDNVEFVLCLSVVISPSCRRLQLVVLFGVDWGSVCLMKFTFVNNFTPILLGLYAREHILGKSGYIILV